MEGKSQYIVQIFPHFEEQIDFLFKSDENFRDLCSDYLLCTTMLLQKKKDLNQKAEDIVELEELQHEMEGEIRKEIMKKGGSHAS